MKIIYLTLFVLTCTILKFDVLGQDTSDYQLFLRDAVFVPEKNISVELAESSVVKATGRLNGKSFMIIQFEHIPDESEKARLKDGGIELLDYVPNKAFTATVTGILNVSLLKLVKARSVVMLRPEQKMEPGLASGSFPAHAEKVAGMVDVRLSYPRTFSFEEVSKQLLANGFEVLSTSSGNYQVISVRVVKERLTDLAASAFVQYIEPVQAKVKELNDKSVINSRTNTLFSTLPGGYNLQGKGVVIGVGDDANPLRHIDFSTRVINRAAIKKGSHGLHVTGSIAGAGIIIEKYRGYAPKSTIVSQYFSNILNCAQTYVDDYNMVITNNSYGIEPTVCSDFGGYNLDSYQLDVQASDMPHLQQVFAAGNSGNSKLCTNSPANFANILTGFQAGKNIIAVGNTDFDGVIDPMSSRGPLRDGRLKPEIVAPGMSINSTFPIDSYTAGTGTSFSSPAVSGGLALLYERYRLTHNNADPQNALMKALICNGGTDLGPVGPDYTYGFGWMNLLRSLKMMESNNFISDQVADGLTKTHTISVPANTAQVKIMLYWNDRASSFITQKALINDLDLTVTSSGNVKTLPKVLNPSNPSALAVNDADHLNNIEQIVLDNPAEDTYTISVKGNSVPENTQQYYVVYDIIETSTTLTYPVGNERMVRNDLAYVSWDSYGNQPGTFKVQYSINNGTTWANINTAVAANLRQITWIVPDFRTTQAKVRVTNNATGAVSESQIFSIFGSPVVSLSGTQCEGYIAIQWPALPNITDYEIMRQKGDEMVSEGFTTDTKYTISGLSRDSTYYVSVRARIKDGDVMVPGRRGTAVTRKPDTGNCEGTISDNDLMLDAIVSPASSGRKLTSTEFSSQTRITIRVRNLDDVALASPIEVSYSINDGQMFTETISPAIAAGDSYDHNFTLKADMSAINAYKIKVFVNKADDPVTRNNTLEKTFKQFDNLPVTIPFFDGAEGIPKQEISVSQMGLIGADRYDFTNSSPIGRLRTFVNSNIAFSGSMAYTLDANKYDAAGNTNYLIGTFNLALYVNKDVRLTFQYKNHGQLNNPNNKVWIRGRDTDTWLEVYDLFANQNTPPNGYKLSSPIEVNNILRSHGQTLSASFQVRWGQWGDIITADNENGAGYTIDDINIFTVVNDVQLLSINSPVSSGCGLGSAEQVKVTIRNSADHTVNGIAVKMQVDQGTVWEKIITMSANSTLQFSHPQLVDLSAFGKHYIKVWVDVGSDSYAENDAMELYFYNAPVISSFPYLQNFESGNGFWYSEGKNNSWEYGTPSSPKINKAASGVLAWKTKIAGNYNDDELSYLYSPCFAIGGLAQPTLSFSTALDIEDCADQACDVGYVEYSTDGNTWTLLGSKGSGTNWYDESNGGLEVWSVKDYTRWHVSTTPIPTGASTIRFRFVLKSDQAGSGEGIAIDDIHVYNLDNSIYSSGPVSATVTQSSVNGSDWISFTDGNKIIASIMPNNQDMGSTDLNTYLNTGGIRNSNSQYYLNRSFTIKPANGSLADFATIRLYFPDTEVETLLAASDCPSCVKPASAYELAISKYTNTARSDEDGDIANDLNGNWLLLGSTDVLKVPYDNGYYAEFKTKTFSEFWLAKDFIAPGAALPVELISFTAKKKPGADASDVALEWATASEKNFDHFEVEVALGEENVRQNIFSKIGEVVGSGDSGSELKYSFLDRNITDGLTRYYRLKMVDVDETFSYSNLRSVLFNERQAWRVFPNPSTGVFNLEFKSEKEKQVTMRIYDLSGRLIKKATVSPTGSLQKQKIDLSSSGFEPGVYMLEIASGQDKQVFKLMRD